MTIIQQRAVNLLKIHPKIQVRFELLDGREIRLVAFNKGHQMAKDLEGKDVATGPLKATWLFRLVGKDEPPEPEEVLQTIPTDPPELIGAVAIDELIGEQVPVRAE